MKKEKELATVELMIRKYCRAKHGGRKGALCEDCATLLAYAAQRLEKCPHGENKPFCSNCSIHCYKRDMKEKIRLVMRYAGPRMIWDHPVLAFRHLYETKREKRKLEATNRD